jgi:hypothetical protein
MTTAPGSGVVHHLIELGELLLAALLQALLVQDQGLPWAQQLHSANALRGPPAQIAALLQPA